MTFDVNPWNEQLSEILVHWKWMGLILSLLMGFLLHSLGKKAFLNIKNSPWARQKAQGFFLHFLDTNLHLPASWLLTSLFWRACLDILSLPPGLDKYLTFGVQLILSVHLILLAYRGAEALGEYLKQRSSQLENSLDFQLLTMATKVFKIFVVIFGTLIALQNFKIEVMSLLAGLGLGGLALALAAQDTAANLFGSLMIVMDRPFRVGDFIKVGTTEGIVEEVGFRSTRIRTPYNSLVTIPNSVIAKETIDNLQMRPQRRIRHVLGLTYSAQEEQIGNFMRGLETYLQGQTHLIDPSKVSVHLLALGDFSIQIVVQFFAFTNDPNQELKIQQDFLFYAMKWAQTCGVEFAFPTATRIVRWQQEAPQPPL